ncbi:MAG: pseudouridine-5'-phosphate glycosidase [Armatimonadota bacterium]|nr:pseudouridine-5'-phosphate glycosidase [Armatimonadota bacterium]MDR7518184.1 pseudouridine-5'-phosphate glycosidase [Armatimonadota bacterium]MDR7548438.1 pseudouridine-5'-phosphate glycosidase [Armatimonadota bacterium]
MRPASDWLLVAPRVAAALAGGLPVVALESAVFSHGLPPEASARLVSRLGAAVEEAGALPALVAVREGRVEVGIDLGEWQFLTAPQVLKLSERDLAFAVARRRSGGTTVAGTLAIAHAAGLRVMATGGIGGVHLGAEGAGDVSADLVALSRYPLVVVCAGAKVFCDHRRTAEALESLGVPVVGYRTGTLPAFLTDESGLSVPHRVDHPAEIAAMARAWTRMGGQAALLVVQPPPAAVALAAPDLDRAVAHAMARARREGVAGPEVTPFLLNALAQATGGRTVETNLALLEANARLAAEIAAAWSVEERAPSS